MRSALEWAQVRALVADGSEREIARRLGINRRTVAKLARSEEPPRYRRAPAGSRLDPLEPVLRRLLEEWPADQGLLVYSRWRENPSMPAPVPATEQTVVRIHGDACPCTPLGTEKGPYPPFDVDEGR